jgi:arylsulfatase A-like enzyme
MEGASNGICRRSERKTPNLDQMAKESVNFSNAVSVLPVCTPHRAALITGKYPQHTGMFLNDAALPENELTMAEIYKKAGYQTAYIGKWHLDGHGRQSYIPKERRQGFDYWKVLECTHNYNKSKYFANDDTTARIWPGYDAYAQTEDASAYIRTQAAKKNPFILVLAIGAPHFPHNTAPENQMKKYKEATIVLRPNVPAEMAAEARKEAVGYYAHCSAIDSCIGVLRKQ